MAIDIGGNALTLKLEHHLEQAKQENQDSIIKLSTGNRLTASTNEPAARALAEKMEYKIRSVNAAKNNTNSAMSMLQTTEESMQQVNNIVTRMKEINLSAATTTVSNQERRYLMVEYEALYNEVNRLAVTTEFNGIPLLNGQSDKVPAEMIFRVGDPFRSEQANFNGEDVNSIKFTGLKAVNLTTEGMGVMSAKQLLEDSNDQEGISLEDVQAMIVPEDDTYFATVYDQALGKISSQRAVFGALQERMNRSLEFMDVYQENIAAARSKIADTDYAQEVSNMLKSKMAMSATTALMAHAGVEANQSFQALNSIL